MFSLGDLPENHALEVITGIDRDLQEFKAAQRVGGDSLVTRYNQTAATWDVEETVPSSVTFIRWRIVFTPDHGGAPFSLLGHDYDLSPADTTRPVQSYPDPANQSGGSPAWILAFTNNNFSGTALLKFKVAVTSMDIGTIAITKVFSA